MIKPKDICDQAYCKEKGFKVVEIAMQPPTFCKDHYIEYLENRLRAEGWKIK